MCLWRSPLLRLLDSLATLERSFQTSTGRGRGHAGRMGVCHCVTPWALYRISLWHKGNREVSCSWLLGRRSAAGTDERANGSGTR